MSSRCLVLRQPEHIKLQQRFQAPSYTLFFNYSCHTNSSITVSYFNTINDKVCKSNRHRDYALNFSSTNNFTFPSKCISFSILKVHVCIIIGYQIITQPEALITLLPYSSQNLPLSFPVCQYIYFQSFKSGLYIKVIFYASNGERRFVPYMVNLPVPLTRFQEAAISPGITPPKTNNIIHVLSRR